MAGRAGARVIEKNTVRPTLEFDPAVPLGLYGPDPDFKVAGELTPLDFLPALPPHAASLANQQMTASTILQ